MADATPAANPVLWEPSPASQAGTRLAAFIRFVREERGVEVADGDYAALHRWSLADLAGFWEAFAAFWDVRFAVPAASALGSRTMPGAEWFPGARLSYVEHVFRDRDPAGVALVSLAEGGELRETSWAELESLAARAAGALARAGVQAGDRVVGYLPNVPEAVALFLGAASLGAVWASCSPDFGPQALIDRFGQLEPAVLVAADGYRYGGSPHDRRAELAQLRAALPGLRLTVVLPFLEPEPDLAPLPGAVLWDDFLATGEGRPLQPAVLPFEHPLWVLFTSGTTGLPKGIVHSQGGILLEHLKWCGIHVDAKPGDRVLWLTTTGWTMWNFLTGVLLTGAAAVLYEGSPGYPDLGAVWRFADRAGVTCLGAGASFYAACLKAGVEPRREAPLAHLRSIGSTGSPLTPEAFDWLYEQLGPDLWLFSTSGGTDVCSAFVGGVPLLPVRRGELQAPALGVDLQAWDESGRPLPPGRVGELVVTQPMPSMPVRLWNDPDGARLRDAYFAVYPGVWRHGDWLELTPSGGAVIHGRSDSTINRNGVRIGSAEIYRAVATVPEVEDAVVVDVPQDGGESWLPLFVSLREGTRLDDRLRSLLVRQIRTLCSPRHVPSEVIEVPAVPRTLSGKVLEVPVKRLLQGEAAAAVASRDSLANPAALDWFADFAASRRGAGA